MSHLATQGQSSTDFIIQLDWKIYGETVFEHVHLKKNQKGIAAIPVTSINLFLASLCQSGMHQFLNKFSIQIKYKIIGVLPLYTTLFPCIIRTCSRNSSLF